MAPRNSRAAAAQVEDVCGPHLLFFRFIDLIQKRELTFTEFLQFYTAQFSNAGAD